MKRYITGFFMRGLVGAALGPIVLAVVYLILFRCGVSLSVSTVAICREILTIELLAFVAGGVQIVYRIERISTLLAGLVHAAVLYLDYAVIYLVNGWIPQEPICFLAFTLCFFVGFALIWLCIWFFTRRRVARLNLCLSGQKEERVI